MIEGFDTDSDARSDFKQPWSDCVNFISKIRLALVWNVGYAVHLQYTVIVSIMRRASHKSSNNLITNSVFLGMKSRIKSKSLMEWWQFIFSLPVTDFVYFCLQAWQQNNKPRFTTNLGTVYFFANEVPKLAPKQYGKSIFTWSVSQ